QLIRNKLEEIGSGLIAIENYGSICAQNIEVFSGLVASVLVTVNKCHHLTIACVDISYSGKRLMQSYLDVKDLSEFYTARILSHGFTIIVSRLSVSASKDDMRFYIRGLLKRMKIGDTEMKKQALGNLYNVLVEDERFVKLIIKIGDIVNVVVQFLDSSDIEIHREASNIVNLISGFYLYKGFLVKAGIIGPLVCILETGNDLAHGGMTAVLKICPNGDFGGELIGPACEVLKKLRVLWLKNEFIDKLLFYLRNGEVSVQESTLKVTSRLCYASEEAQKVIGEPVSSSRL
ncbi:hypothetical protein Goari_019729, partial [Gossypium aridum]|nr:hypothetical protein [Gossypium aridum]